MTSTVFQKLQVREMGQESEPNSNPPPAIVVFLPFPTPDLGLTWEEKRKWKRGLGKGGENGNGRERG